MTHASSSPRRAFLAGLKAAVPVVFGYLPIGFAFGAVAGAAGLTTRDAGLMSLFVFAGASQFAAVGLISAGYGIAAISATTFLINLRHLIMSASLAPSFRQVGSWKNALLAYGITDETFAVTSSALDGRPANPNWAAGLHMASHAAWVVSSIAGAALGGWIPDARAWGLDFALPAMFIGLLVPQIVPRRAETEERAVRADASRRRWIPLTAALLSAAVSLGWGVLWPGGLQIVVATLVGATAAWLLSGREPAAEARSEGRGRVPQAGGGAR